MQCGKGKMSWLMMLGCLLPIIALFTLPLFGIKSVYLNWLAFLICPLMMFFMMRNDKKEKGNEEKEKCH